MSSSCSTGIGVRRSIRVNTEKISVEDFKILAKEKGWRLEPVLWCKEGFFIDRDDKEEIALGALDAHVEGLFYVQEASSMFPPEVVDFKGGELILDASCAPGSKLTQIAAKAHLADIRGGGARSMVIGNEPKVKRLMATGTNLERLDITNVVLTKYDASYFGKIIPNRFDKVFLDAPCSNTGRAVARSAVEAGKDRASERKVKFMAGIQKRLIAECYRALKPGGIIVYSTCSSDEDENENVVRGLLKKFPGSELVPVDVDRIGISGFKNERLPGTLRVEADDFDTDGFYIAVIKKGSETLEENESRRIFSLKKATLSKNSVKRYGSKIPEGSADDYSDNHYLEIFGSLFKVKKSIVSPYSDVIAKITPQWVGRKLG